MSQKSFTRDVLPFIIATGGEFAALFFWLRFLDDGRWLLANVLLWAGFLVERIAVVTWLRFAYRQAEGAAPEGPGLPLWKAAIGLLLITLSEILIWLAWLWVADTINFWLAAVALMLLMLIEHSVEMSFVKKTGPFAWMGNGRTIFFTLMEVLGGVGWLYYVRHDSPWLGALFLLVGLSIEHVLQGSQLKPDSDQ